MPKLQGHCGKSQEHASPNSKQVFALIGKCFSKDMCFTLLYFFSYDLFYLKSALSCFISACFIFIFIPYFKKSPFPAKCHCS